jgi:hypothetical protein
LRAACSGCEAWAVSAEHDNFSSNPIRLAFERHLEVRSLTVAVRVGAPRASKPIARAARVVLVVGLVLVLHVVPALTALFVLTLVVSP